MQFLSISRRRTDRFPPEAFTPELVANEGKRVKVLYAAGILRPNLETLRHGRRDDTLGG